MKKYNKTIKSMNDLRIIDRNHNKERIDQLEDTAADIDDGNNKKLQDFIKKEDDA